MRTIAIVVIAMKKKSKEMVWLARSPRATAAVAATRPTLEMAMAEPSRAGLRSTCARRIRRSARRARAKRSSLAGCTTTPTRWACESTLSSTVRFCPAKSYNRDEQVEGFGFGSTRTRRADRALETRMHIIDNVAEVKRATPRLSSPQSQPSA